MDWSLLWGVGPSGILGICWNLLEFVGICWNLSQCRVRCLNTFSWSYCIASTSTRNSNHHLVSSRLSGEREIMWIGFCFATSKCLIHRFSSGSNSVLLVSSSSIHRLCCLAGVQFSAKERIGRHECDAPFYLWSGWRTLWVGRFASLSATCRPLRIWVLSSVLLSLPLSGCVGELCSLLLHDQSRLSDALWGSLGRVPLLLRSQSDSGFRWAPSSERSRCL